MRGGTRGANLDIHFRILGSALFHTIAQDQNKFQRSFITNPKFMIKVRGASIEGYIPSHLPLAIK